MLNQSPPLDALRGGEVPATAGPIPPAKPQDRRLSPGACLAPLNYAISSRRGHHHRGVQQTIIRFHNGYGAIITEGRWPGSLYEIAPVRFRGSGPDDYEFYFRSHVPDLTWCSDHAEILSICEQISRLGPPSRP